MKYFSLILVFLVISCGNKEDILLPKSDTTVVKNLEDLSPVYIFFRTKGKDTLAEVNRKNTISTTNWIFHIDKRLPLRIVIPEIMKLQDKRRKDSAHKNEDAKDYYSYADSIGKNLAFLPFTNVYYKLERPKKGINVFFTKDEKILVDNVLVKENELQKYINNKNTSYQDVSYCFDENMSFGNYIKFKVFIVGVELKFTTFQEFVY